MSPIEKFSCLLVDDDVDFVSMLAKIVSREGGDPFLSHTIAEARGQVTRRSFDLIILDNGLPDGKGYDFYTDLVQRCPTSVVVMITGSPELKQAVELTRNGLFDYLTKPVGAVEFEALLGRVKLRLGAPKGEEAAGLQGDSPKMQEAVLQLRQAARHANATVLLLGETGTGKDLAARFLHRLTFGERADSAPYVALNCPNVPSEMFEAELFGNEKGAYTGADRRRVGLAESAQGGTLFLDEIAEIPLALQSKLLRFLESREYRPLGGTTMCNFTGRIIAATNRSLAEEVRAGRFREDLMYRLDVFSVRLPALQEHLSDLEQIAETLLAKLCEKYNRPKLSLRPQDIKAMEAYTFPGNVRELRNLIERSLLRSDPQAQELVMDLGWLTGRAETSRTRTEDAVPIVLFPRDRSLTALEQQEYELIAKALADENGGIRRAAAKLGLTHQALLRRLQKWPELRRVAGSSQESRACHPPG